FKSDLKFLKESKYSIFSFEELPEEELPAVLNLYRALYIHKYSTINPQFNVNFIKNAAKNGILHIKVIKENNDPVGVVGNYYQNGVMISPFFGYDPAKSEKKGVYRVLSTLLMLDAQKLQAHFNQSAGGSFYKKIRRAQGHFEYTAVYHRHLPLHRRLPWNLLK